MHPLVLVPLSLIELVYRPWLFLRAIPPSLTCRSLPCELIPSFSLKFLVVETVCETRLQFCGFSLAYARSLIRFVNQALWSSTLLFISILFVQPTAHFVSCIWHCIILFFGGGFFSFHERYPYFVSSATGLASLFALTQSISLRCGYHQSFFSRRQRWCLPSNLLYYQTQSKNRGGGYYLELGWIETFPRCIV